MAVVHRIADPQPARRAHAQGDDHPARLFLRNSRAEKYIFSHNDPEDLARQLAGMPVHRPKLVCFESVYSMDGDIAPVGELCDVADSYGG
jgi:5-aminolevulinate synthase